MSLPWKNVAPVESEKKRVFCLLLGENTASIAVAYLGPDQSRIGQISLQRQFTSAETLLAVTDECIQDLGSEVEDVDEVLLCVSEHWADAHDILPEKISWIEKLLSDLSLRASGFIGLHAAFTSLLLRQPNQATQLVFFVFPSSIAASVVVRQHVLASIAVGRSDDFSADCNELLARIAGMVPVAEQARVSVTLASPDLDNDQLDQLQQELLQFDWQGKLQQSVTPPITYIKQEELYRHVFHQTAEVFRSKQLGAQWMTDPLARASNSLFGPEVAQSVSSMSSQSPVSKPAEPPTQTTEDDGSKSAVAKSAVPLLRPLSRKFRKKRLLAVTLAGFFVGILVWLAISAVYLAKFSTVQVVVEPEKKSITQELAVDLSPGLLKITDEYSLPIEVVEQEVQVQVTKVATGTKTIGEKAKGKVKLVNKTEQSKQFDVGTTLTAGNGVQFLLDAQVTVPAASVSASATGEVKEYGSIETQVTAQEIGDAGNIGAGQDMKVASFSDTSYSAQSLGQFEGGSSEEVAVVAEKDIVTLRADAKSQATKEALAQLKEKKEQGKRIAPPHEVAVVKETFSAKAGEEAEEIQLTLTAKAKAFSYNSSDTRDLALAVLESSIPNDAVLATTEPQVLAQFAEATGSAKPKLELNISAQVVNTVDETLVKREILGKPMLAVTQQGVTIYGVKNMTTVWRPALAKWFNNSIPTEEKRIVIYVQE